MRKNSIILGFAVAFLISLFTYSANAQEATKKMNIAEFEKRKTEYITEAAELSKEEANKFFPVYNELTKKRFELHKEYRGKVEKMKDNKSDMSADEYKKLLENDVELKIKEAELEKEYSSILEKVISPEKLYKAQQAERKFMQEEIKKFRKGE